MRIYFALTRSDLEGLASLGGLETDTVSKLTIYAQTEPWIAAQDESDPEVLDDEILTQTVGELPGYLVVAEVSDAEVSELNPIEGQVRVHGPIRLKDVAAFFHVDENAELSWFGPTELPVLLDLGR